MSNKSTTILIVDDNDDMRKNIIKILENTGYCFLEAANYEQMQVALRNNNVDIIVLDLRMPVSDPFPRYLNYAGLEYLKSIKKHDDTIRVIIFSVHADNVYKEDAYQLDAFYYIVKSEDFSVTNLLRDKVREAAILRKETIRPPSEEFQNKLHLIKTLIVKAFSLNELDDLCMQLAIDYNTLVGSDLDSKARELVRFCDRRGQISQLISICTILRPNSPWPQA